MWYQYAPVRVWHLYNWFLLGFVYENEEIFRVEDPKGHVQQVMEIKIQGIIQGFGNEGMNTKREEGGGRKLVQLNNCGGWQNSWDRKDVYYVI